MSFGGDYGADSNSPGPGYGGGAGSGNGGGRGGGGGADGGGFTGTGTGSIGNPRDGVFEGATGNTGNANLTAGDIYGNDDTGYAQVQGYQNSTPFLLTHNGEKFDYENDFLFGKPNTAFANERIGLASYQKGIGGDTYLIQNKLKADEEGNLHLQIRELEPEESFIDKFELNALDLKETEHFVADGNLEDSYVFYTNEARVVEGQTLNQFHKRLSVFSEVKNAYVNLGPNVSHSEARTDSSSVLESGDELIIRVPKTSLQSNTDTFILVDSHYRDWSLGNQVPFSRLERFMIGSVALSRKSTLALSGAFVMFAGLIAGTPGCDTLLQKIISIPYTYADTPHDPCGCNMVYSSDDHDRCSSCRNNRGGSSSRSLVLSVGDSTFQQYLQTLFPRYVQASQEVVRIPKEIIAQVKEHFLTVRIKATKKHKVRAAFVFQGTPTAPRLTPLTITKAVHRRDSKDYADSLKTKNHNFLHTIPGDVIDVTIKDTPRNADKVRRYVLRANGFYTRMSLKTHWKLGKNWLNRLTSEDRKLLRNLKLS